MMGLTNPDTRMKYVCGFLFDKDRKSIALIRKKYPPWQAGYMNGVGGRIEAGEKPLDAMQREFNEEAGMRLGGWKHFCTLHNMDAVIHWFIDRLEYTVEQDEEGEMPLLFHAITSPEPVYWCRVDQLDTLDLIPNTRWLIVMAMLGPDAIQGNVWPYDIWEPSEPYTTGSSKG
jgi:8-oxo-dGTP diphosphatase